MSYLNPEARVWMLYQLIIISNQHHLEYLRSIEAMHCKILFKIERICVLTSFNNCISLSIFISRRLPAIIKYIYLIMAGSLREMKMESEIQLLKEVNTQILSILNRILQCIASIDRRYSRWCWLLIIINWYNIHTRASGFR